MIYSDCKRKALVKKANKYLLEAYKYYSTLHVFGTPEDLSNIEDYICYLFPVVLIIPSDHGIN